MHPDDLDVVRVRGTKNPDLERIIDLAPDLVVASEEENLEADVVALRAAGILVGVTDIRTVDGAFASIERLEDALDAPDREWLATPRAAEPYPFTATDGPEAFGDTATALVNGQALTWYGPRMISALAELTPHLTG